MAKKIRRIKKFLKSALHRKTHQKDKTTQIIDKHYAEKHNALNRAHPIESLKRYFEGGRHEVEGWLWLHDSMIIKALSTIQHAQGWSGPVMEIGVFHGKSAILFELLRQPGEKIVCLDIFQGKNRQTFEDNLLCHVGKGHDCLIVVGRSEDYDAAALLRLAGPYRIYHVDGDHSFEGALHDLKLSAEILHDAGILIVDDVFVTAHPDVTTALYEFVKDDTLAVFALSVTKAYLCRPQFADFYQNQLRENLRGLDILPASFYRRPILALPKYIH